MNIDRVKEFAEVYTRKDVNDMLDTVSERLYE